MKVLLVTLLISTTAFAAGKYFDENKKMVLANMDKRIAAITEHKSCVSSASDRNAMKACIESHKAKMKALKESNKSMRKSMKEKRKAARKDNK